MAVKNFYTLNGLYFRKCKNFLIVYHDSEKSAANYGIYCNAGFFGNFKNAAGKLYTLPSANLVCDPWVVPIEGQNDVMKHWFNGKLRFGTNDPHTDQFHGKLVSTFIVGKDGKPYIKRVSAPPADSQYAVSGIPCVINGQPMKFDFAMSWEGWDASPMRPTMRNWIGVKSGEIWLINGRTTTPNYLDSGEFWNKVKSEGFSDIIALDGGGSAFFSDQNGVKKIDEVRRINNVIVFS